MTRHPFQSYNDAGSHALACLGTERRHLVLVTGRSAFPAKMRFRPSTYTLG